MNILYVTTIGGTMNFFNCFIKQLLDEGHTVDIATNESNSKVPDCYREWGCSIYHIDTSRNPLNIGNVKAIKQLESLVTKEKYDIVHCHTPVAAMCTRFACRKIRKNGTKVIYTAHGFHFYKGAPLKNWLLYYPVEKLCSHFTDVLITINHEDYTLAKNKMKAKQIEYVPGVGIDLTKFGKDKFDKSAKRKELGISEDATLLLSVGELNENKNHETVIRAIENLDVYYIIAGTGSLDEHLQSVIDELGMTNRVKLLGIRNDIGELCETADVFVMPSYREGLSVALMEAMASGLPCVVSNIRGNTDLIDENGGSLFEPHNIADCKKAIQKVLLSDIKNLGMYNLEKIKTFSLVEVNKQMNDKIFGGGYYHLIALITRLKKRKELAISEDAIVLTSVGELNTNKNHQVILRAMSLLNNNNLYYLIAGKGDNEENLLDLAKKLNIQNFRLLGYRNDIPEIYNASDICCFPSIREGLGLAAIEGMACGLPLIVADNRGTRDFCENNVNGFLCNPFSVEDFANAIEKCINDSTDVKRIVKNNIKLAKKFDCNIVNEVLSNIYNAF